MSESSDSMLFRGFAIGVVADHGASAVSGSAIAKMKGGG